MMFSAIFPVPVPAELAGLQYRPQPAIYGEALTESRPWPFLEVGTGGLAGQSFMLQDIGYQQVVILKPKEFVEEAPYAKLMQEVKAGFGRTMSRLPEVFGVSRQTLYNWLAGETPKLAHQERLLQLAQAARVFQDLGIKPTVPMLERTVAQGKNFLQLLADGADGQDTARKLIRVAQRGSESRAKLDELLGTRRARLSSSDIGTPSLDENA